MSEPSTPDLDIGRALDQLNHGVVVLDEELRPLLVNSAAREGLRRLGACVDPFMPLEQIDDLTVTELTGSGARAEAETSDEPPQVFSISAHRAEGLVAGCAWMIEIHDVTGYHRDLQRLSALSRLSAIGQLTEGIAHDFNNILFAIMSNAELVLRSAKLDARTTARLERIGASGAEAAEMIKRVRDFAQHPRERRGPLSLDLVVREAVEMLSRALPSRINVVLDVAGGGYELVGELDGLRQVITNLAINARDAMPGTGDLLFTLRRRTLRRGDARPFESMQDGPWATVVVKDSGRGMTPEEIDRAFEPFFSRTGSAGLGLAQVWGIVKRHRGFITVESPTKDGCLFTVWLPLEAAREETAR